MSREIKFRVFDPNCNEMLAIDVGIDKIYLFDFDGDKITEQEGLIIMQYTGLKDKNGTEIYEGDIVKVSEEYGGNAYSPQIVDFEDCCFVLRRINYMSDYNPMFKYDFTKVHEVIGNIYKNKELLQP